MIIFEKMTYKNFLSYGNTITEWNFEPGSITRVTGENGAGKSSCIVDALYFALFGKTFRKQKLEQLVNWVNKKDTEVKIWFKVVDKKYLIHRGLKPSFLKVYNFNSETDEYDLIPISSSNFTYQKIIEEDIIQMNESIFNQTIIKSMTKNLSFMNLSKREKREVIESILGIEIFSHMNNLAKHKLQENKHNIDICLERISAIKMAVTAEQNNLESLKQIKKKMEEDSKLKLVDLEKELVEQEILLEQHIEAFKKLSKYSEKESKLEAELDALQTDSKKKKKAKSKIETDILLADRKIEMFATTCPECPKIKEMKADDSLAEMRMYVDTLNTEIDSIKTEIDNLKISINKVKKILTNETFINNTLRGTRARIKTINADIIKAKEEQEVIKIDETNLKKLMKDRKKLENDYNELTKAKRHFNVLKALLADEGIKSFIIKRYLPHINKILNTYLQKFNTNILFYFDTEFNDIIGSRFKENSNYNCFSEGQKRRIDLSVLFTFIDFSQIKNRKSNSNILILDEITAGFDLSGENILYDILREISVKENKEIVTVSQSNAIDPEKIDRLFEVTTENGFSKLELIES